MSENGGFGRERGGQDNETTCDVRENWKVSENCLGFNPIYAKHAFFATGMSCKQVARSSRQNLVRQILNNLSKCFLWLEGPIVNKAFNQHMIEWVQHI